MDHGKIIVILENDAMAFPHHLGDLVGGSVHCILAHYLSENDADNIRSAHHPG